MRIKAGADKNHLRRKTLQPRQPGPLNELTHRSATGVGRHWQVEQVGRTRAAAALGVERVLEKTHHQNSLVARHNVFGAIAVVHIKIDNRHPLQAMALQRILGRNRHIVEKAKTHRPVMAGMVAGRTHGTKRVV